MCNVLILGGTTEGRLLAEYCVMRKTKVWISVASGYGQQVLPDSPYLRVHGVPMDEIGMENFLSSNKIGLVLDATHPYAVQVTAHAKEACSRGGISYRRVVRDSEGWSGDWVVTVDSAREAASFLEQTEGNILLTTGSKELAAFSGLLSFTERIFARVLPSVEALSACIGLGLKGNHIVAMQGPFSEEMNAAVLRQYEIGWLVTKEAGAAGGFSEKLKAAELCGVNAVVIGRPSAEQGISLEDAKKLLDEAGNTGIFNTSEGIENENTKGAKRQIALIGTGMGGPGQMTLIAQKAAASCDVLFGAPRMVEGLFCNSAARQYAVYRSEDILEIIKDRKDWSRIGILYSGDTGFYSEAGRMLKLLEEGHLTDEYETVVYPGISTVSYLCAAAHMGWEDAALISLHGREQDLAEKLCCNKKVFALLDSSHTPSAICRMLISSGMGEARLTVGERLSYEGERIVKGSAKELENREFDSLCAVIIEWYQ